MQDVISCSNKSIFIRGSAHLGLHDFSKQQPYLEKFTPASFRFESSDSKSRRLMKWTCGVCTALVLASVCAVIFYALIPVPFTPLMVIRSIESVAHGHSPIWNRDWVSLDEISKPVQTAVVAAEDARFFEHSGFDFEAIDKALRHNWSGASARVRGGSTISQQVAKNVFLWPARSWLRKGIEAYMTVLIELLWSKHRIMEVYLNVAEFGDGVYGVEAASQKYFHKPATKLNLSEASLLASVLPNPHRFQVARPTSYVRFRQSMILRRARHVNLPK
jgi:monofunctional biosynthetic peptidoglycan transglycosylase